MISLISSEQRVASFVGGTSATEKLDVEMRELLDARFAPITDSWGFVEAQTHRSV